MADNNSNGNINNDALLNDLINSFKELNKSIGTLNDSFKEKQNNKTTSTKKDLDERYRIRLTDMLSKKELDQKFVDEYKEKLEKLNELEREYLEILEDENKTDLEKQEIQTKFRKAQEEILEIEEKINEQVNLENKKRREGLTLEEEINLLIEKRLIQYGINSKKINNGLKEIKDGFKQIKTTVTDFLNVWGKIDQAAFHYGKTIAKTAEDVKNLRKGTIGLVGDRSIGIKYNTSADELIKIQEKYNTSIGRSVELTNDQKEGVAALKSVVDEEKANDFITKYEKFGLNTIAAQKAAGKMFADAKSSGIVFETYSKNFLDNIQLAQTYTFENGLKGLQSMAKKATELKIDMKQVASFADKVSNVEGAIKTGASLSVLGGPFAGAANPMGMLYEGLNDMEGLQDRMAKMISGLGKWNNEKGMVDISAFNKQRLRAAAEAMGVSYESMVESVNAQGRRRITEKQIAGSNLSDKTKEMVLNTAQIDENGKAYVTINGERKDVDKITEADKEGLEKASQSESEDIKDIATMLRGWDDMKSGFSKQWENSKAQVMESFNLGDTAKKVIDLFGSSTFLLNSINFGVFSILSLMGIGKMINGGKTILNGLGGGTIGGNPPLGGSPVNPTSPTAPSAPGKFTRGVNKLFNTSSIPKTGLKGAFSRGGLSTIGKGIKAARKSVGAIGGGLLSAGITAYDEFLGENKNRTSTSEKTAKFLGAGLGGWGGAAAGAAIGTALIPIPGVGTLIGAAIGGFGGSELGTWLGSLVGGSKSEKISVATKNGLGKLKGLDDNAYTMDDIRDMIDGNIDAELSTKMNKYGDMAIYNQSKSSAQYKNGFIKNTAVPKFEKGEIKSNIAIARGRTHAQGGIFTTVDGRPAEVEDKEAVISGKYTQKYRPWLKLMNEGRLPVIKSSSDVGYFEKGFVPSENNLKSTKVKEPVRHNNNEKAYNSQISFKPLDVNVSGSLELKLGNQVGKIDIKSLMNTPEFRNEIANIVIKEMNNRINKGNVKEKTFSYQMNAK